MAVQDVDEQQGQPVGVGLRQADRGQPSGELRRGHRTERDLPADGRADLGHRLVEAEQPRAGALVDLAAVPVVVSATAATSATSSRSTIGSSALPGRTSSPARTDSDQKVSLKFCAKNAQRTTVQSAPDSASRCSASCALSSPRPDSSTRRVVPASTAVLANAADRVGRAGEGDVGGERDVGAAAPLERGCPGVGVLPVEADVTRAGAELHGAAHGGQSLRDAAPGLAGAAGDECGGHVDESGRAWRDYPWLIRSITYAIVSSWMHWPDCSTGLARAARSSSGWRCRRRGRSRSRTRRR